MIGEFISWDKERGEGRFRLSTDPTGAGAYRVTLGTMIESGYGAPRPGDWFVAHCRLRPGEFELCQFGRVAVFEDRRQSTSVVVDMAPSAGGLEGMEHASRPPVVEG